MKKMLTTVLLVLGLTLSVGLHQALADTATFMRIPGIRGSSTDPQHQGWIEVASLTQTLTLPEDGGAGGSGPGRPRCSLEVMKPLDIAGPLLWGAAVTFQVFGEVQIDVRRQAGDPQPFYHITLQNALITSISTIGNGGYIERVTLTAGSVQLRFFRQRPDGSAGGAVSSQFECLGAPPQP